MDTNTVAVHWNNVTKGFWRVTWTPVGTPSCRWWRPRLPPGQCCAAGPRWLRGPASCQPVLAAASTARHTEPALGGTHTHTHHKERLMMWGADPTGRKMIVVISIRTRWGEGNGGTGLPGFLSWTCMFKCRRRLSFEWQEALKGTTLKRHKAVPYEGDLKAQSLSSFSLVGFHTAHTVKGYLHFLKNI